MRKSLHSIHILASALAILVSGTVLAQPIQDGGFEPTPGQPGKDVVWVPTPYSTLDKMLEMAKVTPRDFVMDLGSGDGRMVIAAAKRGARAQGVEYNPDLVALSTRNAAAEGVSDRARFVQGDMYEADISQATVLALFLLPENLRKLVPKFLQLPAGTRILNNGYKIPDWQEVETGTAGGDCEPWCTVHLYLVPAKVEGTWRLPAGEVNFTQDFQTLKGVLAAGGRMQQVEGTVKGDQIRFTAGLDVYTGRVSGNRMSGEASGATGGHWSATRK
jgi:SAM-dependent methyltransferase